MKTIAIANQKGGVGKTTTALNIADALMHSGYSVLFIDVDPQTNSTSSYKAIIEDTYTVFDLFQKECTVDEAIQHTDFGDIIAGDSELSGIELQLQSSLGGFNILKNALKKAESQYDFCIIDTPPNLGIYMLNALIASDLAVIPVKAEKYAIDGLTKLLQTINDVKMEANPDLEIAGILLTTFDKRNELDNKIWKELKEIEKEGAFKVFANPIRICQDVKKAQDALQSLYEVYPNCNAAYDYALVTKELIEKGE